jgi:MoaA/NifB/PqqE/SkfB family radical SAM enzyme
MLKEIQEQERKKQEEERRIQEQERKRLQEEERKKQEEERRKQEQEWKKHEERLRRIQEKIKKVYVKTGETAELVTLKEGYIKKDNSIYIYGDNEDLHDRVSSRQGDFKKSISKIKTAINKNKNIKIGISKFNFFKLNEIAQFCSSLMNRRLDLRSVVLNPLPLKKLYLNFFDYIRELNARIGSDQIEFFLKDEKLLNLLYSVSSQANQYNERELLRLLGVISEHPFIGPQTIVLDTYHHCNTNCIHCWIHTPKRILSPKLVNLKMSFSLYKNIVNDAVDLLCDEIIIQGDGEPLLDNRFLEMVQYARNKGLKVIFFTNAILLDEKKAKRVIELEIDEIYCSLPAGTDKTYAVINSKQSKETFHKIAHNLKNFILLRNKLKRNKPSLQMTHVIHDLNHHELEEMARLDAHIGADRARFYLARLDENIKSLKVKPDHIEVMKKSLKKVAPYLKKEHIELQDNIWFQLKNYNSKTGRWSGDKFLKSGCPVGWFFCLILAKGELSMCCHLRVVDYLGGKSFKEVWNSESYNKFRSQAKYIMKNKDITFRNGVKLYDEYCNNCDTHQVILKINELLKKYNLEQFYKGSVI